MTYKEAVIYQIKMTIVITIVSIASREFSKWIGNTFSDENINWIVIIPFILFYIFVTPVLRKWLFNQDSY